MILGHFLENGVFSLHLLVESKLLKSLLRKMRSMYCRLLGKFSMLHRSSGKRIFLLTMKNYEKMD